MKSYGVLRTDINILIAVGEAFRLPFNICLKLREGTELPYEINILGLQIITNYEL